jgi:hypothetical protein
MDAAPPGDILLFNVRSRLASVQRTVCRCFWDHVGIVTMTRADERLQLLEATQQGVLCLPLRQRLVQYAMEGAAIAARIFSWHCDSAQVRFSFNQQRGDVSVMVVGSTSAVVWTGAKG